MLFLTVLGGLSVDADGAPATGAAQQRRTLALLALLVRGGRRGISRDKLSALLWPERDAEHGRNLLKQACYALRRDLHAPDLIIGSVELRLNPDVIGSDLQIVEDALDRGDLKRAVEAYTGPFLDGFHLPGAGEFERSVEETRAAIRQRIGDALESLATEALSIGDAHSAVKWWRQLAVLDPLSARSALGLLRALNADGDRAAALAFGRVHETLLRSELDTTPDPAVSEILERLREGRTDESTVVLASEIPTVLAAPQPRHSNAERMEPPGELMGPRDAAAAGHPWRQRAMSAAVLLTLTSVVAVAASNRPAEIDPHLVAVAPFDIIGRELAPWQEGLVDVMSRNLDGAGLFRTVTPTSVVGHWTGRADRASATRLGKRTGAAIVVFGELLVAGPDSVRLRGAVLDTRHDRLLTEVDRTEQAGRIDRLADSAALDVIRALVPAPPGVDLRLPSIGTASLPALKAFLKGEQHLRRLAFDSAIASYARAIAFDTGFSLALRHMGVAMSWGMRPGAEPYFMRAASVNRGLSTRDSLMIASDSQPLGDHLPGLHGLVHRKYGVLSNVTVRYPNDAEAWAEFGGLFYHYGFILRSTWHDALGAFDRAIAVDSTFALAYILPVEIALTYNDRAAALRYVRGFMAIPSVIPEGAGMRLTGMLIDRDRFGRRDLERELTAASLPELRRVAFAVQRWPDANETQIDIARRLLQVATEHFSGANPDLRLYVLRPYQSLLADALIFRGHLREARELVGGRLVMQAYMELAHLGAIDPASVEASLARDVSYPDAGDNMSRPLVAEGPCYRTMDAALWWASRRDTANLKRLLTRDSAARVNADSALSPYQQPAPGFVRAALSLAQGDTAGALRQFLGIRPRCLDPRQLHETRFQLLVGAGRDAEAAALFDASYYRRVPMILERARIAERLGDRATAIEYYQFAVQAWLHADPELQPMVADARSALARLGARVRP